MRLGHGVWTVCGGMEPSDTCDMAMVREAEVPWKATASWVAGTIRLIQKSKIYFLCHVLHVTPLGPPHHVAGTAAVTARCHHPSYCTLRPAHPSLANPG